MKTIIKRLLQFLLPTIALILAIIFAINYWVLSFSKGSIFLDVKNINNIKVGLVFGASVKSNLEPSDILKDRLKVAVRAYNQGKIKKIIVSGDNGQKNYNEPVAMEKFLISKGVKKDDIYLDYAGFDTYDSIYRAKYVFGVDKIVFFSQEFHLKRALYIAKKLRFKKVIGISTNLHKYRSDNYNQIRETLARVKAFLDVEINNSKPIVLGELVNMNEIQEKN